MFNCISIKGGISSVKGFYCDGISIGLKPDNGLDLAFIRPSKPCNISYLFTTNRFKAAPLKYVEQNKIEQCDFILINAKNANAMTGKEGIADVEEIMQACKEKLGVKYPLMSSTGSLVCDYLNKRLLMDCKSLISKQKIALMQAMQL